VPSPFAPSSAAKNVILMGVKSVTLFDPAPAQAADLSAQFYLTPDDVGKPRAAACVAKLAALNQYVNVAVLPEAELTEAAAARYQVIVAADQPAAECLRLDAITRGHGTKFIAAEARGVFARIFCDFGPVFRVDDVNGEPPVSCLIAAISKVRALVAIYSVRRVCWGGGCCVTTYPACAPGAAHTVHTRWHRPPRMPSVPAGRGWPGDCARGQSPRPGGRRLCHLRGG
jgi:hypothetical protein